MSQERTGAPCSKSISTRCAVHCSDNASLPRFCNVDAKLNIFKQAYFESDICFKIEISGILPEVDKQVIYDICNIIYYNAKTFIMWIVQ